MTDFASFESYNATARLASLALSPDGTRLVTVVSTLAPDGKTWQGALWEVDPTGEREAVRLTRSAKGDSSPVFAADGSLLFLSARPDPLAKPGESKEKKALWRLPVRGEAAEVLRPGAGVGQVRAAGETVLFTSSAYRFTEFGDDDNAKRKAREDAGVTAILHESYPIRYWDADLGPAYPRLLAAPLADVTAETITDLSQDSETRLSDEDVALSPDGKWAVYGHAVDVSASYGRRTELRIVATNGGASRAIASEEGFSFHGATFTHDSSAVIAIRFRESTSDFPHRRELVRVEVSGDSITPLAPGFQEEPDHPVVSPDGSAVFFTASHLGHQPLWRLDLETGEITKLTVSGYYSDLVVSPDSKTLYALRNSVDHPPQPVRFAATGADQDPERLRAPGAIPSVPGTLTEISTVVADGRTVRSWLVLPEGASADSPVPLVLWVHGGPVMSWNGWTWRWNPWLMAARGYAVLLPDPALSTGYGPDFIKAGWGRWGAEPYTDLMAITDVAVERADINASRTAAMGGSFGGYMANWIATQTDRFRAIVTHASLWHLDAFSGATDSSYFWMREMGDPLTQPERILANSPHLRVADIKTPMLVIHGDKDYRVPIGEGHRLYFDLVRHGVNAKYLYYPTENHWILTPGNSRIWYETVWAFLAEHVLDQDWERPELL
ncbi:S9 family peptidase [Lentzea californiensis]|uniref:S9 family peptidase n=1 Tax=Lentzea californiensis TaxID=438851 RepID=UPI0021660E5A|nr:S9 family peptidase [Lentzea californiensis]MCR3751390.1 Dipeptidyl aminopeptidase/acylaminoacyl peptidase [Lentzea californiensis]